jgi:hypothetical protein
VNTYSKFDWVWRLGLDGRLPYADRYILTMTALKSASPRDMTFCIRQATIAENCAASERAVRRALTAGRRHGYLELVRNRKRGRGNHGADEYRLTLPANEIPATGAGNSTDKYRPPAPKIPATGAENTGQTRTSDQQELQPPIGLLEVSRRFAAGAAPPPEPRYCPKHPHGTVDNCPPCGRQRQKHQRWQAEQAELDRLAAQARARARADCHLCDGYGWAIGPDGTPLEPARRCPGCKPAEVVIA